LPTLRLCVFVRLPLVVPVTRLPAAVSLANVPQAEPDQVATWRWRLQPFEPPKPARLSVALKATVQKADGTTTGPPDAGALMLTVGAVSS
jgi:hypothetical protein